MKFNYTTKPFSKVFWLIIGFASAAAFSVMAATTISTNISTDGNLTVNGSFHSGADESTLDPIFIGLSDAPNRINSVDAATIDTLVVQSQRADGDSSGVVGIGVQGGDFQAYGTSGYALIIGEGGQAKAVGGYTRADGPITAAELLTFYAYTPDLTNGATADLAAAYWAADFAGSAVNPYYSWFDSRGVRRVKEDNTFNSVGQAIEALYNPQFTKYTPGATNYERIILGQWSSNTAQIGTEAGGTGTLRPLQLIGSGVGIGTSSPSSLLSLSSTATTTVQLGATGAGKGGCIQTYSPNHTAYRIYVSNNGTLTTQAGSCH